MKDLVRLEFKETIIVVECQVYAGVAIPRQCNVVSVVLERILRIVQNHI